MRAQFQARPCKYLDALYSKPPAHTQNLGPAATELHYSSAVSPRGLRSLTKPSSIPSSLLDSVRLRGNRPHHSGLLVLVYDAGVEIFTGFCAGGCCKNRRILFKSAPANASCLAFRATWPSNCYAKDIEATHCRGATRKTFVSRSAERGPSLEGMDHESRFYCGPAVCGL
jgi:hypothetical protein